MDSNEIRSNGVVNEDRMVDDEELVEWNMVHGIAWSIIWWRGGRMASGSGCCGG